MVSFEMLHDKGIAVVRTRGPIDEEDFHHLATEVDAYIEEYGELNGLLIDAEEFPGWDDFDAFVSNIRFVREYHRLVSSHLAHL